MPRPRPPSAAESFSNPDGNAKALNALDIWSNEGLPLPLEYPPGVVLFRQGDKAAEVFYLEVGLIKLLHLQESGEERIVALRSAGWLVAATAAILHEPHSVTAVTLTVASLARTSTETFRRLLKRNGELSWQVHLMHSVEVCAALQHIAELSSTNARKRLLQALWRMVPRTHPHEREVRIELPIRYWELAQLVGVTPVYLSQLFKSLEQEGALRRNASRIFLYQHRGERAEGIQSLC
jgi:CRP-like cAMP-binding protein